MNPRGPQTAAVVALCALLLPLALTGCGGGRGEGGLKSAGATPVAVGPVQLWPELPPATSPPVDYGKTVTERVPGVRVPDNDVSSVDPVAVVRAEVRARPGTYTGGDGMYEETARAIEDCDASPVTCPVLRPYYRDLTGNGRDELIVGIRMPDQQVGVRVYLAENGGLTRIMSTVDQVISVEVAGLDLIMRVGSAGIPGYEYRTAWSWDEQQHSMLPTRDEIVRVKPPGTGPSTPPAPRLVSPTPAPTPGPPRGPAAAPAAGDAADATDAGDTGYPPAPLTAPSSGNGSATPHGSAP
ncbi:hypothetical protein [Streptomyces sp. NPDC094049]|uniref:hypothetical protein n=1 Tax=Streptomyces sp. NPDC094049 TaxID=3154987 RepID=UPI0033279AE1